MSCGEQLVASRLNKYRAKLPLIATIDDVVVGVAKVVLPLGDNEHVAYVYILVHPGYRRRGIAAILHESVQYDLGRQARAGGSHEFDLVYWEDHCPESLVDSYAHLRQRMSVDVPSGSLEIQEESRNAARVRHAEEKAVRRGTRSLVAAMRRRPSGQLAGHTILEYAEAKPEVVFQDHTLVLTAFRRQRLGMALKAANMLRILAQWPLARRIYTWNAAENAHMLRINEILDFRPAGFTGSWQKRGFGAASVIE